MLLLMLSSIKGGAWEVDDSWFGWGLMSLMNSRCFTADIASLGFSGSLGDPLQLFRLS